MQKTIYSEDHKYIVNRLVQARNEIGFTQSHSAMLLGKTQSYISKIESGQRQIDIVELKEFAKIYKKNINYFLK